VIREIFAALARLRSDEGLAILLVEQNVRAAFKIADHAYVMDRGRVLMEGEPSALLDDERVQQAYLGGGYVRVSDESANERPEAADAAKPESLPGPAR
jgi:branched-chain amino acid transport system ATP-binding protein